MPEISYESLEPLLSHVDEEDGVLRCTFTCPLSGEGFEGAANLVRGRGLGDVCAQSGSLTAQLRRSLGFLLIGALGHSKSQRARAGAAALKDSGARVQTPFDENERKAAMVVAFRGIASHFVWDDEAERWIAAGSASDLLTDFARQLGVAPVEETDDREILSRMLTEVARADGKVTPSEWAFLGEFIPADLRSVDTAMEQPKILAEDLGHASRGASRDTMLMLAWGLALADADLDRDETQRLLGYAGGLRIPEERALELRGYARLHLLDDAFHHAHPKGKSKASRVAEALALGKRLGMSDAETTNALTAFKHRRGIEG